MYTLSLYIFRRDLRIADNQGLIAAQQQSRCIIPCFIVDPHQVSSANTYRSLRALEHMRQSIHELAQDIRTQGGQLVVAHGSPVYILEHLYALRPFQAVFVAQDYTPFARTRDADIAQWCQAHHVAYHEVPDVLLTHPDAVHTASGEPYQRFTSFWHAAARTAQTNPTPMHGRIPWEQDASDISAWLDAWIPPRPELLPDQPGGRAAALAILSDLTPWTHYAQEHDRCTAHTTQLAAHIKFGTVSIREVYTAIRQQLGPHHPLLRQLYWRDFFTHVLYHHPHVLEHPFHARYNHLTWSYNQHHFEKWCTGTTGFPIVDAGMRALNATGYISNRMRMVVASFLTKDLGIDWRWGQQYFAQHLVDYDPAVNNGNWQWVASTGCDAQPYFRIINPWIQQQKYDPECTYIKTWVPELRAYPPARIHRWATRGEYLHYPKPMVDHQVQARERIAQWAQALRRQPR